MPNLAEAAFLYCLCGVLIYSLAYLNHNKGKHFSAREEGLFAESLAPDATLRERVEYLFIHLIAGSFCLLVWPIVSVILVWHKLSKTFAAEATEDYSIHNCKIEHLVAKTSLVIAEISGQVNDPTGLTPRQPFGYLHSAWVEFCSEADFESEIWRFRIPKGTSFGPHSKRAVMDIQGYAIVKKEVVIAEFMVEFH
jgi:hypothetical protein